MPRIELTDRFKDAYAELPAAIQKKTKKTLRLLDADPRHPSLQSKPIEGAPGIFEARVDLNYRLTFERIPGDALRLRVIGKHDRTLKTP
jgi:hypothetical protein